MPLPRCASVGRHAPQKYLYSALITDATDAKQESLCSQKLHNIIFVRNFRKIECPFRFRASKLLFRAGLTVLIHDITRCCLTPVAFLHIYWMYPDPPADLSLASPHQAFTRKTTNLPLCGRTHRTPPLRTRGLCPQHAGFLPRPTCTLPARWLPGSCAWRTFRSLQVVTACRLLSPTTAAKSTR